MQFAQPEFMDTFFQYIFGFFDRLFATPLQPWIPWGPGDWYFTITTSVFVLIILYLVRRIRKGGGSSIADGVRTVIASTGDVTAGMSGAKKLGFLRDPADALVFLKIEVREKEVEAILAPPPEEEMEILFDLARRGDMRAIRERTAHIETLDEQYAPFARRLQKLAESFENRQIRTLIERYMEEDQ